MCEMCWLVPGTHSYDTHTRYLVCFLVLALHHSDDAAHATPSSAHLTLVLLGIVHHRLEG